MWLEAPRVLMQKRLPTATARDRGRVPDLAGAEAGFALLALLFLLFLAGVAVYLGNVSATSIQLQRSQVTLKALAQAKEALIGYAASHPTLPGALPCPDTDNDGFANTTGNNCSAYIGRLPWQQLGLPDLRDGYGECLWYAVSPDFRDALPASIRTPTNYPLNSSTAGQLTLNDASGNPLSIPPNPVVALIFSPGPPLAGQDRTSAGSSICGGNNSAAAYLDTAMSINNATGNAPSRSFIAANKSATFDDTIAYIAASDLFPVVNSRVAAELRGLDDPPITGLRGFYDLNHYYPWAASSGSSGSPVVGLTSGKMPYAVTPSLPFTSATQTWLTNNDWFSVTTYKVAPDFEPGTSYAQQCLSSCLVVKGYAKAQAEVIVGSTPAAVCTKNALVSACPYP